MLVTVSRQSLNNETQNLKTDVSVTVNYTIKAAEQTMDKQTYVKAKKTHFMISHFKIKVLFCSYGQI